MIRQSCRLVGGRVPVLVGITDTSFIESLNVARVAADPPRHRDDARPGGSDALAYWRLHGTPRLYRSAYPPEALARIADEVDASACARRWVIFDNTAAGCAVPNAAALQARVKSSSSHHGALWQDAASRRRPDEP